MVAKQGQGFATLFFPILQKLIKFAMAMLISGEEIVFLIQIRF